MVVEILERNRGVPMREMRGSDIAYDVHVRRVFLRTNLADIDNFDPTWLMSPARVGTVSAICGISDPLRDAGTPREAHRGPVCEGRFYARLRLRRWGEAVSPARGTGSVFGGHGAPARRPNARRRHSAAGAVAVSFALAACGGPAVTSGVTSTRTGAAASGDFGHLVTIGGDRRLYLECRGASGTCRPCSPQQVNGPHTYWSEPRGAWSEPRGAR